MLLPQGGGSLGVGEWLGVLDRDYLQTFVAAGGAAVKLAVPGSPETAAMLTAGLRAGTRAAGLAFAEVDAAEVRVHLIDQVYAAVSRQLDWPGVAAGWLLRAYDDLAVEVPRAGSAASPRPLGVESVAVHGAADARELLRSLRLRLEQTLLADAALPRDLRTAVLRLAQGLAGFPEARPEDSNAALAWLRGEPVPAALLRRLGLSARVSRSTARPLLTALGQVLAGSGAAGASGIVLVVDARRLAVARRPPLPERDGVYYSGPAVLDTWEVLRQLIDAADQTAYTLVVVVVPPELVTDTARGLPAYSALHLRVADEVRDRRRANPFATLVRLDVRLEAVA